MLRKCRDYNHNSQSRSRGESSAIGSWSESWRFGKLEDFFGWLAIQSRPAALPMRLLGRSRRQCASIFDCRRFCDVLKESPDFNFLLYRSNAKSKMDVLDKLDLLDEEQPRRQSRSHPITRKLQNRACWGPRFAVQRLQVRIVHAVRLVLSPRAHALTAAHCFSRLAASSACFFALSALAASQSS